jgi:hypothetical protein
MEPETPPLPTPACATRRWSRRKQLAAALVAVAAIYVAVAYFVAPSLWKRYTRHHPALDNVPGITLTSDGHPGDPLNVALIGAEAEVRDAMRTAGWDTADALGLRSDVRIAADTVLRRAYADAPVSNLFLFGRKEDLAFEQPVGGDPRRRHHVRFWLSDKTDPDGRPFWVGSVTYDEHAGLSHTTGQITHHIAPDVDAERDRLIQTLEDAKDLSESYYVDDFHKVCQGTNGGGDPWRTDGRLAVGVIRGE